MSRVGWSSSFASEPDRPLGGASATFASVTARLFGDDGGQSRLSREERAKRRKQTQLRRTRTSRLVGNATSFETAADISVEANDSRCLAAADSSPCCSALPCAGRSGAEALDGEAGGPRASSEQDKVRDASSLAGVMLGLPTLETAGWKRRDGDAPEGEEAEEDKEPAEEAEEAKEAEEAEEPVAKENEVRAVATDNEAMERRNSIYHEKLAQHAQHYLLAMECLGLEPVSRCTDGITVPGRLLTFKKADVPSGASEVKALLRALEKIVHVNFVQLLQACESEEHLHLVYEDCAGAGHLVFRMSADKLLQTTEAAVLLQELAAVVSYCEKMRLSLLDWSMWNVMCPDFASLSPAKLFGIGLAGVLYEGTDGKAESALPPSSPRRSTFRFRPPELVKLLGSHPRPYQRLEPKERRSVDVWSLGAVVFHALAGNAPFSGGTAEEVHGNALVVKAVNVQARLDGLPADAVTLLERCMSVLPGGRPPASTIVAYPWVTTEVGRSRGNDINTIIDRLSSFVEQHAIMRALGKLFMQVLKPEKERAIRAMFRTIDATGDGEISCQEVIALAAHRRDEVKEIFKSLGEGEGQDASIDWGDFSLANVFAEGILTQRMLLEAFNSMDDDNSGCISAAEFYQALNELDDGLTPADVCKFIKEAERDWNFQLNFEEFCRRFPTAQAKDEAGAKRRAVAEMQRAYQISSAALRQNIAAWAGHMGRVQKRLVKVEVANNFFETAGSTKVCSKLFKVLGEGRHLVGSLPVYSVPAEAQQLLGKRAAAAMSSLDDFLREREQDWLNEMSNLQQQATEAVEEEQHYLRRSEVSKTVKQAMELVKEIQEWIRNYSDEQADNLEASAELEGTCPGRPWSRRAIASVNRERAVVEEPNSPDAAKPPKPSDLHSVKRKVTVLSLLQKFGSPLQAACGCDRIYKAS